MFSQRVRDFVTTPGLMRAVLSAIMGNEAVETLFRDRKREALMRAAGPVCSSLFAKTTASPTCISPVPKIMMLMSAALMTAVSSCSRPVAARIIIAAPSITDHHSPFMLEAEQLVCLRGDRLLFDRLAFRLEQGEALRVAGANGVGKTSLLRMLCGLMAPAGGDILWRGASIRRLREEYHRQLIYVGHASAIKDDLTAAENLLTAAALAGLDVSESEARQALQRIGLGHREDLPAKVLSQGQRRRVVLARLLLSARAPLWILDEPFTALDRAATAQLCDTIASHLAAGGLLVMTTHQEVSIAGNTMRIIDLDSMHPC